MYIQITSRCNMNCCHCCYNCTAKGTDMTMKVFETACELASQYNHDIFIGGGEPTLHPKFWAMLGMAMTYSIEGKVGLITNGSITETALRLARMAHNGIIYCGLSQDMYHDRIDKEVIAAFSNGLNPYGRNKDENDLREVRNVGYNVSAIGRAKTYQISSDFHCVCEDIFVAPSGKIYECGCKKKSLGTVFEPSIEGYKYECSRAA